MLIFFLIFFQYILFSLPVLFSAFVFFPILKLIYGKHHYENLNDEIEARVSPILKALHKNSYNLKKLDENPNEKTYPFLTNDGIIINQAKQPCIIVTKNSILINQHRIKNLSDQALSSSLLYEINLFEKKSYIKQLISSTLISLLMIIIILYSGLAYTLSGLILGALSLVLLIWFMEYISFAQKRNAIKYILKKANSNNLKNGLKEYLNYLKSYLDYASNVKYDIDKMLNFLSSFELEQNSKHS